MAKNPRTVASVSKVVDTLDMLSDQVSWYIHVDTGEVGMVSDDMGDFEEDGCEGEDAEAAQMREMVQSDKWMALPGRFEVHEWSIMERFALSAGEKHREELLDAIHRKGAFRAFRGVLGRLGLTDKWYEHRAAALRLIASNWLEDNGFDCEK